MLYQVLLFLCAASMSLGTPIQDQQLQNTIDDEPIYRVCGNRSSHALEINDAHISPMPLTIPGDGFARFRGRITRSVSRASLSLSIWKGSWIPFPMPCIDNIGSCSYENVCVLVQRMERENWLGLSQAWANDIQSTYENGEAVSICPIRAQELEGEEYFEIPSLPATLSLFASGTFHVRAEMHDPDGVELACLEVTATLVSAGGWFGGH